MSLIINEIFDKVVHNFGKSDSDMFYWKYDFFSPGTYMVSWTTFIRILEQFLTRNRVVAIKQ